MVRAIKAIKAIQSTIRPEQYDQQYGQSNHSNKVCNTIKTNPGVVTLSVALTRDPSGKPDVQEVDVER